MSKIVSIQLLRAVACVLVLLIHLSLFVPNTLFGGAIGVDLFFLISGYIIASSIDNMRQKDRALNFAVNRFSRVVPYYYLMTVVLVAAAYFFTGAFDRNKFILSLLFYPQSGDPSIMPGWSLNHEIFFYLFMTLMLVVQRGKVNHWLNIGAFTLLVATAATLPVDNYFVSFVGTSINITFAIGYVIYLLRDRIVPRFASNGLLLISVVLFLATIMFSLDFNQNYQDAYKRESIFFFGFLVPIPRVLGWGIPSAFLFLTILAKENALTKPNRLVMKIGDASYTVYLIQGLMMLLLSLIQPVSVWLLVVTLFATLGASVLLYGLESNVAKFSKRVLSWGLVKQPKIVGSSSNALEVK
ncbi:acyltransferase family protein [Polluticoccus soli]|uniref:acyltransferase family protein n=1 Tax=Polluticoccus soli TaxID=3034150 RepID=UPI0023E28335|nr:acyltransferase [Flavipsychrobacter sp. JY13-12]